MKCSLLILTVGLTLPIGARAADGAAKPSFDCARATRPVDRLICSDSQLSVADSQLAAAYKAAFDMASYPDQIEMRNAQRAWLAERDQKCVKNIDLTVAANANTAKACLQQSYAARTAEIAQGHVVPSQELATGAKITRMPDDALVRAYGPRRKEIGFSDARFSANGQFLAFRTSWSQDGYSASQAWIYDLRTKSLSLATGAPSIPGTFSIVEQMVFDVDNTLYVAGEWIRPQDQSKNKSFKIAATMDGSHEIPAFPASLTAAWGKTPLERDNLHKREVLNAQYIVTAMERGESPTYDLTMRRRGEKQESTIMTGDSVKAMNFAFDPVRSVVYYQGPEGYTGDEGIFAYDLKTTGKTVIRLGINSLFDISPNGELIAYVGPDRCPIEPASGTDISASICFVQLR